MPRRSLSLILALFCLLPSRVWEQYLLVPMDDDQANHLKAYGLTFSALKDGLKAEWLLNYRGGSFLLPDATAARISMAVSPKSTAS